MDKRRDISGALLLADLFKVPAWAWVDVLRFKETVSQQPYVPAINVNLAYAAGGTYLLSQKTVQLIGVRIHRWSSRVAIAHGLQSPERCQVVQPYRLA